MNEPQVLLRTRRFTVLQHQLQATSGERYTRETVQHPGAVGILPLLADGRICLIHNFRVAVGRRLLEIPAGTLEPDEHPEICAARELAEETGYSGTIAPLAVLQMSPGILNERMHLFVATNLTAGLNRLELGEEIETCLITAEQAFQMVADGRIEDAKTVAALLFARQFGPLIA